MVCNKQITARHRTVIAALISAESHLSRRASKDQRGQTGLWDYIQPTHQSGELTETPRATEKSSAAIRS